MRVWMWWNDGEDAMPAPYKLCVETARKHYDVKFITGVPQWINDLTEGLKVQVRSDLIRLWKLAEEGGFWMDSDVIVLREFPVQEYFDRGFAFVGFWNGLRPDSYPNTHLAAKPDDPFVKRALKRAIERLKHPGRNKYTVIGRQHLSSLYLQHPGKMYRAPVWAAYRLHHKDTVHYWDVRTEANHEKSKWWLPQAYSYHTTGGRLRPYLRMTRDEILQDNTFFGFLLRKALCVKLKSFDEPGASQVTVWG